MANILLGATGSVAAVRVPALYDALTNAGHAVRVVATSAATYFFDPAAVGAKNPSPTPPLKREGLSAEDARSAIGTPVSDRASSEQTPPPLLGEGVGGRGLVFLDEDEWPGRDAGERYQRGDSVLHIELRKWADIFAVAPLDANTLAKLAVGMCDNCLTCVWRAWDTARPVVLAPAMNTLMWQHPFTRRHLRTIAADAGAGHIPAHLGDEALIQQINDRSPTLRVVSPVSKLLACGDVGTGAMGEVADVVNAIQLMLGRAQAA